jgi:hypothetical protein
MASHKSRIVSARAFIESEPHQTAATCCKILRESLIFAHASVRSIRSGHNAAHGVGVPGLGCLCGRTAASERAGGRRNHFWALKSLLTHFTQPVSREARSTRAASEGREKPMRDDFDAIPDAADERSAGSLLTRIYHDIGLAAVAEALRLPPADFDPEMIQSLERGEFYLLPTGRALARAESAA